MFKVILKEEYKNDNILQKIGEWLEMLVNQPKDENKRPVFQRALTDIMGQSRKASVAGKVYNYKDLFVDEKYWPEGFNPAKYFEIIKK